MPDDQSLIAAPPPAPFLFSEEEMGVEYVDDHDGAMRTGTYTGERLYERRPHVYREVVRLLSQRISYRAITRICKVHSYTIQAVADREQRPIEALRLSMGTRALRVGELMIESMEEDLIRGRLKPEHKAFALSTVVATGQLLTGGATSRPENAKAEDVKGGLDAMLDALPEADVTVIGEIHHHTDARESMSAAGGGRDGAAESGAGTGGVDYLPDDLQSKPTNETGCATGFEGGESEELAPKGGGGGSKKCGATLKQG